MPPPIAAADELMAQIRREVIAVALAPAEPPEPAAPAGVPGWRWGHPVHFRKGDPWSHLLVSGWSFPEVDFTWSEGLQATIEIEAPPPRREMLLRLSLVPFCPPGVPEQIIKIADEHRLIGLVSVAEPGETAVLVPPAQAPGGTLRLVLRFPNAISPYQAGLSADQRKLAIGLGTLTGYLL